MEQLVNTAMQRRYFTWDYKLFPDPVAMQESLAAHGRKVVTIVDPHIKRDPNYYIFKEAESHGFFSKDKDGKGFEGYTASNFKIASIGIETSDAQHPNVKNENIKKGLSGAGGVGRALQAT